MTPKFTTRYNYTAKKGIENTMESKTFQECKDDCDINILYRRYLSKGFEPPNVKALEQRYADISNAKTYEDLLNIQVDVKNTFDSLPAEIRLACDYNVDTFLELIGQPHELKELQELQGEVLEQLGMIDRKEVFKDMLQAVDEGKLPDVEPSEQLEK